MIIGKLVVLSLGTFIAHLGSLKGSALHILAQPTPLGTGPEDSMFVLNHAIITAEKVCTSPDVPCNIQRRLRFWLDEVDLRPSRGLHSGWDEAICNLLLQALIPRQSVR